MKFSYWVITTISDQKSSFLASGQITDYYLVIGIKSSSKVVVLPGQFELFL